MLSSPSIRPSGLGDRVEIRRELFSLLLYGNFLFLPFPKNGIKDHRENGPCKENDGHGPLKNRSQRTQNGYLAEIEFEGPPRMKPRTKGAAGIWYLFNTNPNIPKKTATQI
jgi:hypothetical protein